MLTLLLHPVRLRIVNAMSGGQTRTTSDLCARLADVPRATVYRHIGLLAEGTVLEVVGEQRVRGAVERHYRLRDESAVIDDDTARSMSLEDHRHGFAAATAALLAEFDAYLDRDGADPPADIVCYKQGILWLDHDELVELTTELRAAFAARAPNRPRPGRNPHLASLIMFPTEQPEQASGE